MNVTKINYEDLFKSHNINDIIKNAYGKDGLGILLIEDIPNLMFLRENLLQSIKEFAELPENIKNKYVHDKSNYSVGWSHGKEKMKKGKADYKKGSFYAINSRYNYHRSQFKGRNLKFIQIIYVRRNQCRSF